MAVDPKDRTVKVATSPPAREIKTGGDPNGFDTETMAWNFHRLDHDHSFWGWNKLKASQWRDLLKIFITFEGITWGELKKQSGGRKAGTNHHPIPTTDFTVDAKRRLTELRLDEYATLFSLRLNNTLRLYGVREGRVLQLVWHDPYHGSGNGACPTASTKKKSSKK
jgi:hypothetical protein